MRPRAMVHQIRSWLEQSVFCHNMLHRGILSNALWNLWYGNIWTHSNTMIPIRKYVEFRNVICKVGQFRPILNVWVADLTTVFRKFLTWLSNLTPVNVTSLPDGVQRSMCLIIFSIVKIYPSSYTQHLSVSLKLFGFVDRIYVSRRV